MEVEKQPEPVPLGVAKELLEKELSVREHRLRCIDCGSFQAVPDSEPDMINQMMMKILKNIQVRYVTNVVLKGLF